MKGSLYLIGSGPGDLSLLPDMARRAIEASDVVIGYAPYLDLLRPLLEGKEVVEGVMTQEEARAAQAIDRALEGKNVALISSGDIGIYGLASLVFEILQKRDLSLDVWTVPGISALNAANALLGAPLNHDFCAISLSDLLTPWPVIGRRIEAAAAGDFNVVFYNPKSRKRDWQIRKAAEILRLYRPGTTPVGIVKNAYRKDQDVRQITLEELPNAPMDMFTTVVVGNSTTRVWKDRMFTPRGYNNVLASVTKHSRSPNGGFPAYRHPEPEQREGEESPLLFGADITAQSFRIIENELGPHRFTPEELAVAVRVIHSTADFGLAPLLRFKNNFFAAIFQAIAEGQPVITDVEMTKCGISRALLDASRINAMCLLNDAGVSEDAPKEGMTRSAFALRKAARLYPRAMYVIGNAPTALLELIALASAGETSPCAVIGVPVGFVSVVQSKEALMRSGLPACTVAGRRGGSPVAAAILNACLKMAKESASAL